MDNFHEQLNKAGKSPVYSITNSLSYLFFIFSVLFIINFNLIFFIVSLILALILFFVKKKFMLEFEYAYTNGEIDIDVIIEKKKRKRIISFNTEDIQAYGEEKLMLKYKAMGKIINAVATNNKKKAYGMYLISENERYYIRFTPDEKFYELINRFNRRAEIK